MVPAPCSILSTRQRCLSLAATLPVRGIVNQKPTHSQRCPRQQSVSLVATVPVRGTVEKTIVENTRLPHQQSPSLVTALPVRGTVGRTIVENTRLPHQQSVSLVATLPVRGTVGRTIAENTRLPHQQSPSLVTALPVRGTVEFARKRADGNRSESRTTVMKNDNTGMGFRRRRTPRRISRTGAHPPALAHKGPKPRRALRRKRGCRSRRRRVWRRRRRACESWWCSNQGYTPPTRQAPPEP
ncbi:hypothetical protein PSRA_0600 [Pseudoscardovia radai]|uniref:Uncharacterized protein n=1 Tax=Pseudoscardovia radai TaxID=987066 RepID=A0A261EZX9_9BIFI|nr:hypothetical protein PSRA_0600 [Pseudoscardovia radai]